jgi:hypothetical protein
LKFVHHQRTLDATDFAGKAMQPLASHRNTTFATTSAPYGIVV